MQTELAESNYEGSRFGDEKENVLKKLLAPWKFFQNKQSARSTRDTNFMKQDIKLSMPLTLKVYKKLEVEHNKLFRLIVAGEKKVHLRKSKSQVNSSCSMINNLICLIAFRRGE